MINLKNKLVKTVDETTIFTIDFTPILDDGIILLSIDSYEINSNDITINTININSGDIDVDNVTVQAHKGIQVQFLDGINYEEYKLTLKVTTSDAKQLTINAIVLVTDIDLNYYGAVNYGDYYFNFKVTNTWTSKTLQEKLKALVTATKSIDRLNFAGDKNDSDQILQFPRGNDTEIPEDIEIACYEEADQILQGKDSQSEISGQNVLSRSFASVRTTYDRTVAQENVIAGIISIVAWNYLRPYLRDPNEIQLSRV